MPHEWLDRCLAKLVEVEGSDLHLKVGAPPRIRVNGTLYELEGEARLGPDDTAEMAAAIMRPDIAEHFREHRDADCAYSLPGLGRFRVNIFQQRGTVAIAMRRVTPDPLTVAELGLPEVVSRLADEERGLILCTGPTGSGKTTTLAGIVEHINRTRPCHIITIEDPVEILHRDKMASIEQREIGIDTHDFASALRAAMRQDPDVILVGEMRDLETVSAALTAAETGHLVLSTLHTTDAEESINRIVDFFPPYQQKQARLTLAAVLKGTIAQRLIKTVDGTGRVAACEVMVPNGRIQQCITDPEHMGGIHQIIEEGDYYGMQTFDQSIASLFEAGLISLKDALMAATNPHDLRVRLQNLGLIPTVTAGEDLPPPSAA
jgi:twitching motility protein PilT